MLIQKKSRKTFHILIIFVNGNQTDLSLSQDYYKTTMLIIIISKIVAISYLPFLLAVPHSIYNYHQLIK